MSIIRFEFALDSSRQVLCAVFALCLAPISARSEDWKAVVHPLYSNNVEGVKIDAPEGYTLIDAPSPQAKVLKTITGPTSVKAVGYAEIGSQRFYLNGAGMDSLRSDESFSWIFIPGTGRADFIAATIPAKLIKRETRDFFKSGPETAEIYEESINLVKETKWGPTYRQAEVDFRLPVKVANFRHTEGDAWEVLFTVYPAFESNVYRIPGPAPENYGEPYQALITRPVQRETRLTGRTGAASLKELFVPNTVWAASFSEGRLQQLRIGWHELEPPFEVSRLSAPLFTKTSPMKFRFQAIRLLDAPFFFTITPDEVIGADLTVYDLLADFGGVPIKNPYARSDQDRADEAAILEMMHEQWNLTVGHDLRIRVVVPYSEGRGAMGMLELESFGLGPSFEEESKALTAFQKERTPETPRPESAEWFSNRIEKLGRIPKSQRGEETEMEH